jgi:hypothetical protein
MRLMEPRATTAMRARTVTPAPEEYAPVLRVEADVEAQLLHLPLRRPTKLGRILAAADGRT